MRFYSDEDIDLSIVMLLRRRHDVTHPREAGTRGNSDLWHLREAAREERVLLTTNHTDFRFLHRVLTTNGAFAGSATHAGILTATRMPENPSAWARSVDAFAPGQASLVGRLYVWHHINDEWNQDPWRPDE